LDAIKYQQGLLFWLPPCLCHDHTANQNFAGKKSSSYGCMGMKGQ
jgi:hypothetical protein